MSIESELFNILTGDAAVGAMIGTRVYPLVLPQNPTLPAVVYQELRTDARAAADGDMGERETRFQLSAWASSFAAVKMAKTALTALLSGYSGGMVERIEVGAMRDDYDVETGWFRQIVEIRVLWAE